MGQLIAPLRDFINKYRKQFKKLYFLTCCGGGESEKDGKFGYIRVFQEVEKITEDSFQWAKAISIKDLEPNDNLDKSINIMELTIQESNFNVKIKKAYNDVVYSLS
ncbi:hypothetical protein Spica_1566 [Gracilinema caldarium DSM 7334]|uniref:Uncharacterized protein n=1 Tax=Gracilinema caldarium (strain ATCC 51460 / DSM 7334 / H1) TaxID=744872 RepID=F8EZB8_GRAC1|nr:hypothetical protein Spica_1566 [Gracilinema caldarium DSM 7334]